jgi:hypothetical protein
MQGMFPMVPLAQRQALCIGIFYYNGELSFGLIGDYDAMADLDSFALELEAATDEISAATPKQKRRRAAAKTGKKPKAASAKASSDGAS